MTSDANLAAKVYHILYPRSNFYRLSSEQYRNWLRLIKELRQEGIIND